MPMLRDIMFRFRLLILVTGLALVAGFGAPAYAVTEELAHADSTELTQDSVFLEDSYPVIFVVNRTEIRPQYRQMLVDSVAQILRELGPNSKVYGRAAASPEGPLWNNRRLANGRRRAVTTLLEKQGVDTARIQFDTVIEDYMLLLEMMRQENDIFYARTRKVVLEEGDNLMRLKDRLVASYDGRLWKHIYKKYFPLLRATRLMITYQTDPLETMLSYNNNLFAPATPMPFTMVDVYRPEEIAKPKLRRELLSLKTNLLGWGMVIPQYGGWCPIPNVALEYYPKHGHLTYGASFDCPWWVGNTSNHKYMEVRNYQLEARYYFRNSNMSLPDNREAAFKHFYVQAYGQMGLYQIGFSAKKGWIGEALGGGLGLGYVLPLTRGQHWRLEVGAQFGYFVTKYDPFVYGKPIYHGGEVDGNYYYDTPLYRDEFMKRQHRYTWLGPTRVGITLSYDLLYRKSHSKRPSFSKWEKGVGL